MGIFYMPICANGHIFFQMGIFTKYAEKKKTYGLKALFCGFYNFPVNQKGTFDEYKVVIFIGLKPAFPV